ncbi:MAG TPA: single-stranded DNA-binding protein [Firmicutes bacterium]|nr:single-stranded DNA-binding protein [Bacillota bacterium]
MNKAILVGRLTKDPELKMTENTKREVCQFTIAVNRPYTNDDGERKADFINCVVWDKLAENLSKYQKKGNQVAVEGRIQTRNYEDKDGKKIYVTEIFVSNVTFLDSKGSSDNVSNLEESPLKPGAITTEQIDSMPAANDPFANFGNEVQINDSDLPF